MPAFRSHYAWPAVWLAALLLAAGCRGRPVAELRVAGPGHAPELEFACCEHGLEEAQRLFARPGVLSQVRELRATVAIPTIDFSPQRAGLVRLLNQQGIPAVAWIELAPEQGSYLNAGNTSEAAARLNAFQQWTRSNDLRWAGVGLDIEPNFAELGNLRAHRWRLAMTLLGRAVDFGRLAHARGAYEQIIGQIHAWGYPVQIYAMPYVAAERSVHSTFADRILGTVDVHADQNYLMLYTTFARPIGGAMIWSLGRGAWGITVGSTDGPGAPGTDSGPLDWMEFSRDLIVAGHFTPHIGVYDLEGCVRQGFLPRLLAMDWGETVVIPAEALRRSSRLGMLSHAVLWMGSNLLWLAAGGAILVWLAMRARSKRAARLQTRSQP
jgi:hypothetical protein